MDIKSAALNKDWVRAMGLGVNALGEKEREKVVRVRIPCVSP